MEWFEAGGSICTDSDNFTVTGAQSVDHLYPRDMPASATSSQPFCLKIIHKNHLTHKQEIPEELPHYNATYTWREFFEGLVT